MEVFAGQTGEVLNPKGGKGGSQPAGTGDVPSPFPLGAPFGEGPLSGAGDFQGPNAARLEALRKTLITKFHLRVTQICRPASATYGAPNSKHKSCRAMDLSGSVSDRVAAARFCKGLGWVEEVFCDQAGMVAPGYDHSDHLHVGA
jgi:hypothetical protein